MYDVRLVMPCTCQVDDLMAKRDTVISGDGGTWHQDEKSHMVSMNGY